VRPVTRRGRPVSLPDAVTTTKANLTGFDEVRARLEAMASLSTYALLGELDPISVLEGNVRLLHRADLHLRVLEAEVA